MDIIVQALSGIMEVTGEPDNPPTRWGLPIADLVAPLYAVNGILAALIHRGRTGEGQQVMVSMLDCLASMVAEEHFDVFSEAGYPLRSGNFHDRLVPFGVYGTRDGYVAIVAFNPDWFKALMEVIGEPQLADDPRFSSRGPRMKHAKELNARVDAWTRQHTSEEVVRELRDKRGVPSAPVRSPMQVLRDPLLHASGALMKLSHPRLGELDAVGMGLPIRFSKTKSQFDEPATELGAANEEIYRRLLKLGDEDLSKLRADRVI
jgi:crotonobetainyl-CoA:carnitine CoA-transferase CaiB-like acyl-CoA transferase